jgi:hypothetical protein
VQGLARPASCGTQACLRGARLPPHPRLPAGEVKKRYWRLSLLIHPDKCSHPRAHDAFQAVTAAAKELQVGGRG